MEILHPFNIYYVYHNVISDEMCDKLIAIGKTKWKKAKTLGEENRKEGSKVIRASKVTFTNKQWVYDLIWELMENANKQAGWNYTINGATDVQITRYDPEGFYIWHKDGLGSHTEVYNKPEYPNLHNKARKLSLTACLNSEYEGGKFEIRNSESYGNKVPKLKKGSVIVFPSFMEHRVNRITKGVRYSLVAWFLGPPFK